MLKRILPYLFVQLFCLTLCSTFADAQEAGQTILKKDSTSVMLDIYVLDASQTGYPTGLTALAHNTGSLTCYYHRSTANAPVQISLVSATIGTYTSGGFILINNTTMPGVYQLHVPNAAFATGADYVTIMCKGAANMVPYVKTVQLVNFDLQTSQQTVTVGTNNDKTGYTLGNSQTFSTTGAVGSVTAGVTVTTNNDKNSYRIAGTKNTLDQLNDIDASDVWNAQLEDWPTEGSAGEYLDRTKHYVVNKWTLDVKTKRYTIRKDDGESEYENGISSSTERTPND